MFREGRIIGKVDVIHLEASYSGVLSQIGRDNGDEIVVNPTRVPLGVLRVKERISSTVPVPLEPGSDTVL